VNNGNPLTKEELAIFTDKTAEVEKSIATTAPTTEAQPGIFTSSVDNVIIGDRTRGLFNSGWSKPSVPVHDALGDDFAIGVVNVNANGDVTFITKNIERKIENVDAISNGNTSSFKNQKGNIIAYVKTPKGLYIPVRLQTTRLENLPTEQAAVHDIIDEFFDAYEKGELVTKKKGINVKGVDIAADNNAVYAKIKELNKKLIGYVPMRLAINTTIGGKLVLSVNKDAKGNNVLDSNPISREDAKKYADGKTMRVDERKINTGNYNKTLSEKGWLTVNLDMQFPMIGSDVVLKIGSLPVPSQIKGVTDVAQSTSEQPSTEVKLETTDRVVFGHPTIGKSFLKNKGEDKFISLDDDYATEINSKVKEIADKYNVTTYQVKDGGTQKWNDEYNQMMQDIFEVAKQKAISENKTLFTSNTNLLRNNADSFDKVINLTDKEFERRIQERGAKYDTKEWKRQINETVATIPVNKVINTEGYLSDLLPKTPTTEGTSASTKTVTITDSNWLTIAQEKEPETFTLDVNMKDGSVINTKTGQPLDPKKDISLINKAHLKSKYLTYEKFEYNGLVYAITPDNRIIDITPDSDTIGGEITWDSKAGQNIRNSKEETVTNEPETTEVPSEGGALDFTGQDSSIVNEQDENTKDEDKHREASDPEGSYKIWDKEKELAWFKKNYPDVPIKVLDDLREIAGKGPARYWGVLKTHLYLLLNKLNQVQRTMKDFTLCLILCLLKKSVTTYSSLVKHLQKVLLI
jgi:hypothetical protein